MIDFFRTINQNAIFWVNNYLIDFRFWWRRNSAKKLMSLSLIDWRKRGRNGEAIIHSALWPNQPKTLILLSICWSGTAKFQGQRKLLGKQALMLSQWTSVTTTQSGIDFLYSDLPSVFSNQFFLTRISTPRELCVFPSSMKKKIGNLTFLWSKYWKEFKNCSKTNLTFRVPLSKNHSHCIKTTANSTTKESRHSLFPTERSSFEKNQSEWFLISLFLLLLLHLNNYKSWNSHSNLNMDVSRASLSNYLRIFQFLLN